MDLKALRLERLARQLPQLTTRQINAALSVTVSELHGAELGSSLWQATGPLISALAQRDLGGARVLELGAGVGTAGIAAALLGAARVVLADKPEVVPHTRRNVDVNAAALAACAAPAPAVECAALSWGEDAVQGPFELVIASDCCYERT